MYEDKFKSYNEFFGSLFQVIKQQEQEKLIALMRVAVDINDKEWFTELDQRYKLMTY